MLKNYRGVIYLVLAVILVFSSSRIFGVSVDKPEVISDPIMDVRGDLGTEIQKTKSTQLQGSSEMGVFSGVRGSVVVDEKSPQFFIVDCLTEDGWVGVGKYEGEQQVSVFEDLVPVSEDGSVVLKVSSLDLRGIALIDKFTVDGIAPVIYETNDNMYKKLLENDLDVIRVKDELIFRFDGVTHGELLFTGRITDPDAKVLPLFFWL